MLTASLRRHSEERFDVLYRHARLTAELRLRDHGEDQAAMALPDVCPYTLDQVLDQGWYPDPPPSAGAQENC
jgi:hypothetical protein